MISAFHSVVVDVRSFESGVADYSRLLGQPPARIEMNGAGGTRSAFFGLANMVLEVRAAPDSGEGSLHGLAGIRFASDEDDVTRALAGRGVSVASSTRHEGQTEGGALEVRSWRTDCIDPTSSRGLPVEVVSDESGPAAPEGGAFAGSSERHDPARTAGQEVSPRARIRALDHVVVLSQDPEGTRAFYGDRLGLRLALDKTFEERGVRLLFFRVGGTTIEIGARLGAEVRADRPDRFGGLAWQVVDLDAIRARLVGDGFDVSEIRTGNKPGTRVCTVRAPVHDVPTLLIEPVTE